jgi:AraC-like DNA-binding protein
LPGCEIIRAENTTHCFRFFHQNYMINMNFNNGGPSRFGRGYYRGRELTATDDDIVIAEPGETQVVTYLSGPVNFRTLFLTPDTLEKALLEMGMSGPLPHFNQTVTNHPRLYESFFRLHQSLESPSSALERQSLLARALRLYMETTSEKVPPPLPFSRERLAVRRALELMREKCTEDVSLESLAGAARLSPYHFLREFTREIGVPPHAYQIQLRLEKARRLLGRGVPSSQTAIFAGFFDQSHMTRQFKKNFGVTPAQYAGASK